MEGWVVDADDHRRPGLDDAGLLAGDVSDGRAGELGVVEADIGDDRDLRLGDVGGVPSAKHADLENDHVHGGVGEVPEGGGGHRLEVGGAHTGHDLQAGDGCDLLAEVVAQYRFGVAPDPLSDVFKVRARVRADGQTRGHEEPGDHLDGRSLAVRAGHMNDGGAVLRVAHGGAESTDVVQ